MNKRVSAIVPAAGLGKRLGSGANKSFISLLNKPLIIWSLEVFETIEEITEVIPVLRESDMKTGAEIFRRYNISKVGRMAPGGMERQDSVYNGLKLMDSGADIVLIHDGCRPLIERGTVLDAIRNSEGYDGAIVAVPVKDTIKEAADGIAKKTLNRGMLWAAQTPQVFQRQFIMNAYETAVKEKFHATDDSALVERLGGMVRVIMGSYENIKVTTPGDMLVAETLLNARAAKA